MVLAIGRRTAFLAAAEMKLRFAGIAEETRPGLRRGHIPGSRNLPYDRVTDPQTHRLRELLRDYGFIAVGEPTAWFYDPPWTLPCRRRNEIAIPVED